MDIRIEFNPTDPEARIRSVRLELPGGSDADLSWGSGIEARDGGRISQTAFNLNLGKDGREPAWDELTKARVLCMSWRGADGQECGTIGNVKVWAIDSRRGIQVPLDAYSDRFPSDIPWTDVDRGARHMVRYFNNNGLPTAASCSGHPGTSRKRFWIDFRADVADCDVARFMEAHSGGGTFAANGIFCAKYANTGGANVSKTLQYTAPDILDAAMDLSDWVADDMSGQAGHGGLEAVPWDREQDAARIVTANMDPRTADALYRAVWKDHVLEDIRSRVDDLDEEPLAPEQEDYAAELYVYEGKYDCNLCYWDNIDNVIQTAREFA